MKFACLFVIALTAFAVAACDAIDDLTAPKELSYPEGWEDLPDSQKAEASFDHYAMTEGCDEDSITQKAMRANSAYGALEVMAKEDKRCLDGYLAVGGREVICKYGIPRNVIDYANKVPTQEDIGIERNGSVVISYRQYFCTALTPTAAPTTPTPSPTPYPPFVPADLPSIHDK